MQDEAPGRVSLYLAIAGLVLYAVVWAVGLNGWRVAKTRYGRAWAPSRLAALPAASVPGVTVIRPCCGLDSNLYNSLETVMRLAYPRYEVIFAFQDGGDEAIGVARLLIKNYPGVDAKIVINPTQVGVNPKVNNLMQPFAEAQYDLLWVIDSTVAVTEGTLERMVDAWLAGAGAGVDVESGGAYTPPSPGDVGLVHQVPIAVVYNRSWGSLIEQAFLNGNHAKMYLSINDVAVDSCVVGKSNMYSRAAVAALPTPSPTLRSQPDPPHGLAGFGPFMAEDNMIAMTLWRAGLKHAMTGDVALDFIGALSVRAYIDRRARWIRVRKVMVLPATLVEPFTESLVGSAVGSWALHRLFGAPQLLVFAASVLAWFLVDNSVRRNLSTNVRHIGPQTSTATFAAAWAARELLALPVWLYAMAGSTVMWRGHRYRILASGEARRVD
ncbi:Ceramide glucosyltransferase [Vanrija albida]|uniref:Ceramide glucosyltransferase n=1 Tax=Vanrija albida TaxID=181172 RepID=A0ABR3Q6B8_9TREE